MTKGLKFAAALGIVFLWGLPLWGQVLPVPLPGGDVIPPIGLINQFFPGVGSIFDGLNADPHGITNFHGSVAMGYTAGTATDNNGRRYNVITDIRVYQGDYIGAVATYGGGRHKIRPRPRYLCRNMNRLLGPQFEAPTA